MGETPRIVVIGSANMDLVVRAERIPSPGETVLGGDFVMVPGGKGANQAVAAARLGAHVTFVGRVGRDAFGDALNAALAADGIDTTHLKRDETSASGVALIGVDARGQNAIMVAPGANYKIRAEDIDAARDSIAAAYAIVVQLEIPHTAVEHAVAVARAVGTRVLLNPAPIRHVNPLPEALLRQVDILTPNEHETANLLGQSEPDGLDWEAAARQMRERGIAEVIITLGSRGCLIASEAGTELLPACRVAPVDTTAAGDCFTGALALALAEGQPLARAARFASRAAAISVTRIGAQTSLPTRAEVDSFSPGI